MNTQSFAALVILATALSPSGSEAQVSPDQVHDRIVGLYTAKANRQLPAGDTLVSWYGNPVLLHTVRYRENEIATGMVRADGLLGTETVTWSGGHPLKAEVLWTQGDSILSEVRMVVDGDSVRVAGTTSQSWIIPSTPWAVADYGMEDQVLPLLATVQSAGATTITIYRPFAAKWDTLHVTQRPLAGGAQFELQARDGKREWWLVTQSGFLVQIRREGQDFERRPLERTHLVREYVHLNSQIDTGRSAP